MKHKVQGAICVRPFFWGTTFPTKGKMVKEGGGGEAKGQGGGESSWAPKIHKVSKDNRENKKRRVDGKKGIAKQQTTSLRSRRVLLWWVTG